MTSSNHARATAARLAQAIAANDADAMAEIYAPDATIWHSTDQITLTVPQLQDLVRAIATVATAEVNVKSLLITDQGFVQTQENIYSLNAGPKASFHAALVARLDSQGRITSVEEYLDSAGLAPLLEALGVA